MSLECLVGTRKFLTTLVKLSLQYGTRLLIYISVLEVRHLCYIKGFCELLCRVNIKALGNMQYLTINTRSNRVVIISSVITRIFLTLCNSGQSHFNLFKKDTRDLFMLCIVFMCQLYCVVFYFVVV
jgi:hypothetical protein